MKYFAGIDIGGTTTTIAIGDIQHNIIWVSEQFPTESNLGPKIAILRIADRLTQALKELAIPLEDLVSIGLSTPGPATLDGTLLNSPNLKHPEWNQFSIRGGLEAQLLQVGFVSKVAYIGDGQAAAFGEFQVRSGRWRWNGAENIQVDLDLTSMFMVIVGTGLGGGEVRNGKVVRGGAGRAGHAGHIYLPANVFRYQHDSQLLVGNAYSTVESAVSLTGLTHQLGYRLQLSQWADHPLQTTVGTTRDKAKTLRELAAQGDALALELFEDQAKALGVGLAVLNYIGDFDILVIGGGVCDLSPTVKEQYLSNAKQAYHDYVLDGFRSFQSIEYSVCGDTAPVIGAVAYAREQL